MRCSAIGAGLLTACVALAGAEGVAQACGGCFTPPETPTVVTDHQMVFSISPAQSTLYDRIRYSGSPESFAWVLPFAGEIDVGVSSDVLFSVIDGLTQTQILPPPQNCPARPASCPSFADGGAVFAPVPSAGVDVLKQEIVGPYEVKHLKASSADSLNTWLAEHKYALPDDVKPVVAAYQAQFFNFLAVKLVPGKGVQEMRPIRVTTKAANVALPLRMVAAGTGPKVGITLWIVAEGRYEPQNFGVFKLDVDEIAWDWTKGGSNYVDLRTQKNAAGGGRLWELESSTVQPSNTIMSAVAQGGIRRGFGPLPQPVAVDGGGGSNAGGYIPETDADGGTTGTADAAEAEDIRVLFAGIAPGSERITRLRADLDHAALDQDLLLHASTEQQVLSNVRQVTKELNEPTCPVYSGCDQVATAPRGQAAAQTAANDDDGCSLSPNRASSTWLAVMLGFFGVSLQRKFRRRR